MRYDVYYSNQVPGSCLVQRVLSPALLPCRRRLSDILVMVVKTYSASLSYVTYCTWHAAYLLSTDVILCCHRGTALSVRVPGCQKLQMTA